MANTLKIKRSAITTIPNSLAEGEVAYSFTSDKLFIGDHLNNVRVIGGKSYIDKLDLITITGPVDLDNLSINTIDNIDDVVITSVGDNEVLAYDIVSSKWINQTAAEAGLATSSHTHNYAGSSTPGGAANSVANSFVIKFDTGNTEGSTLYTFNGSAAKTIDFKAGTNITLTKAAGEVTISAASYSLPVATTSVLGGVKDGTGVTIAVDGTLSVDYGTTAGTSAEGNHTHSGGTLSPAVFNMPANQQGTGINEFPLAGQLGSAAFVNVDTIPTQVFALQVTNNYQILPSDNGKLLIVGANVTLTLPDASALPYGWCIYIKSKLSYTATVVVTGSNTINGTLNTDDVLSDTSSLYVRDTTSNFELVSLGNAAYNNREIVSYVATAGQAVFTAPTYNVGYNELDVFINGVHQKVVDNFVETNSTSITFNVALTLNDIVHIRRTASNGLANPSYLGASTQAVDSALLNGQPSTYYTNADNILDGIVNVIPSSTEQTNWNTVYNWYSSMTTADADSFINTVSEVLNAFSTANETLNLATELTTPSNMTLDAGTF
jgi:hypothetical protein